MTGAIRVFVIFAGFGAIIGFAAEPNERARPKIEIHWAELFPIKGVTADRSAHNGSDTQNDYYPHIRPAMILSREDVADAQLQKIDWLMNNVVIHHYVVTLVLTKDARERLAKGCPGKTARVTVSVDGKYWGWDHYITDNEANVSERWRSTNYSPSMGLMPQADAARIVNAFK